MTDSAAWERHRSRRDHVNRRIRGWLVGAAIVVVGGKLALSGIGCFDGHLTVTARTGYVAVESCARGDHGGYSCTGTFKDDKTGERTEGAVLQRDTRAVPGAWLPAFRTDGGYTGSSAGELTVGKLARALAWLGGAALLFAVGAFFLLTGYMPRARWNEPRYRFGRITFGEAWQLLRERRPALPVLGVLVALCPVLIGAGLLVAAAW
ncbi:hypothetical protein ABII15_28210 [Streptomyces sp. HUAS MG91]|uniref:DUF3592 domain-containing protein n=1 Tax=Streptomyces tabacisoli TaxID=3156398 RepID=A0AAU8IZD3_9ACTN